MGIKASNQITLMNVDLAGDDIVIGGRNLIRNSKDMVFQDYYFTDDIVVTHDDAGNLTWVSPDLTVYNDGNGNITLVARDDGAGNIILGLE